MTKNITAVWIGAAILGTAVVMAAWPNRAESDHSAHSPVAVRVAPIELHAGGRQVGFPAVTRSSSRAELSFVVPARIATLPLDAGDRVRKGDVVATLDNQQYRLALQAAEASLAELEARLDQARRDEERIRRLSRARAATDEELEQTSAATRSLSAAKSLLVARRDDAKRVLSETVLRAPFDGTITAVHRQSGEWAAPGARVVELVGDDRLEVEIRVPESTRADLSIGQKVRIALPLSDRDAAGRVTSVATSAAGAGHLFPVLVTLEDDDSLAAGMAAEVFLTVDRYPLPIVPLEAVLNPGSSTPSVFRVQKDRVERVSITLGQIHGVGIAVSDGELVPGDLVVVAGHTSLADGDTIEVF